MDIKVKFIGIIEHGGGGGTGHSGSGDVSGFVGTGAHVKGSIPGIFNYNAFKKKRKKKKKHNEDVSATGGLSVSNGSGGGEVYGIGTDLTQSRGLPSATGDLIESPVKTNPMKDKGIYGIPVKKKHKRHIKKFKAVVEHGGGVGMYNVGTSYGNSILPNPGQTTNISFMPLDTEENKGLADGAKSKDVGPHDTSSEPVETNKESDKGGDEKTKILNWDSYIKTKMNQITYLN